jgi:hypothetical protein
MTIMSKLNQHNVDASFWSAMLTVGGLDTVMTFLGNLSYIYVCSPKSTFGSFMKPASCRATPFLPKEVLIRIALPQVRDHLIVVFASDSFYNLIT